MCTKGFKVVVEVDIHAVTCPGVWLCPNGKVCLNIKMLGYSSQTKYLPPVFPLLFHEKIVFEKLISTCRQLAEVQKYFGCESVHAELIQKTGPNYIDGIILAAFEIALIDFLYPSASRRGVLTGVDIDLLMEPSKYFPGIISPKVEISTKTIIEEINLSLLERKRGFINPKTLRSKKMENKQLEPCMKSKIVRRGHPICHCCWKKNDRPPFVVRHADECNLAKTPSVFQAGPPLPPLPCHRWGGKKHTCCLVKDSVHRKEVSKCQEMKLDVGEDHQLSKRTISSGTPRDGNCNCGISHRSGNCAVCDLYKKYFPKNQMDKDESFQLNHQYGNKSKSNLQPVSDSYSSDDSFEALSKDCDILLPKKNKQHFSDYGFSSRFLSYGGSHLLRFLTKTPGNESHS